MTPTSADHLAAVTRAVSTATHDDEELLLLTLSRGLAAPPEEVWSALVTPDRIERWSAPVSGDLHLGGRFQIEGDAGGEVLTCDATERLSVTWEHDGDTSWVDVTLRPSPEGTVLQLDHRFTATDRYRRYGPGAGGVGWELSLIALAAHLADPAAARPGSPGGPPALDLTAFVPASADAWRAAAVDHGDDPDQARAAAERCAAAYLGEES